jgi:hypothetical protein
MMLLSSPPAELQQQQQQQQQQHLFPPFYAVTNDSHATSAIMHYLLVVCIHFEKKNEIQLKLMKSCLHFLLMILVSSFSVWLASHCKRELPWSRLHPQ